MFLDVAFSIGHIMKTEYKKINPYLWTKKQFYFMKHTKSHPKSIKKRCKIKRSRKERLTLKNKC